MSWRLGLGGCGILRLKLKTLCSLASALTRLYLQPLPVLEAGSVKLQIEVIFE